MRRQGKTGFTLIELMITVVIVAILAAIAVPAYNKQMMRSRRADAQQFMLQMETKQKQILLVQRGYASAPNALNLAATGWTCTATSCTSTFYSIAFNADIATTVVASPPSYTICATPVSTSAQAGDGVLSLDSAGARLRRTGTSCTSGADLGW